MTDAPDLSSTTNPVSRGQEAAAVAFCILAAVCATYLSGINFPEQNNRWHIPVVLDFAGSSEGPHDAYSRSFANFISPFWYLVRAFTHEGNIERVFIGLQLLGNAVLACAIYTLARQACGRPWPAALATGFLCSCYGLWGLTPLGYSEVFVTYATHTQFAVSLGLFGLAAVAGNRPLLGGALLGAAAYCNLFIALWSALAAGLTLLIGERRAASRQQVLFSVAFLVIAAPVIFWGLRASAAGGDPPPLAFMHDFLAGHVYGLDYPRALAQTIALGLLAALGGYAALSAGRGPGLPMAMMACVIVLAIATVAPYATQANLVILLHPLRFASVAVIVAAACAAAIFASSAGRGLTDDVLFPAALALTGFMLKAPMLSLFGFALVASASQPRLRTPALLLLTAGILAMLLPAPGGEASAKAALSFLLACIPLAAIAMLSPTSSPLSVRIVAAVLGVLAIVPDSDFASIAVGIAALAAGLILAKPRLGRVAAALGGVAILILAVSAREDRVAVAAIGLGAALLLAAPAAARLPLMPTLARYGLIALVPLLMLAGLAKGFQDRFAPVKSERDRNFLAAQVWSRQNTPAESVFLASDVEEGFALFSRRPVWWEDSQKAAVLWQPSFYPRWACRGALQKRAAAPVDLLRLAQQEGIPYLVVDSDRAAQFVGAVIRYRNDDFSILQTPPGPAPTRGSTAC